VIRTAARGTSWPSGVIHRHVHRTGNDTPLVGAIGAELFYAFGLFHFAGA